MFFLYLLKCRDGSIYTGITTDIERRFKEHKEGKGGRFTRAKKAVKLLYTEECGTRSTALKREAEIKRWNRKKKLAFVKGAT